MRFRATFLVLVGIIINLIIPQDSFAKKILALDDSETNYSLDSNFFERIKWVRVGERDSAVAVQSEHLYMNNPHPEQSYWYRIRVANKNKVWADWVLVSYFYSVDEIDVILQDSNGRKEKQIFRDTMNLFAREIKHRQPSFHITVMPNETKTIFIRIKNESSFEYPFRILSPFHFFYRFMIEYFLAGLFYGLMLFVLIYSFINYIFFRDKVVLVYIFFILSQTVHMLYRDGNGIFLLPNYSEYADLIKNLSRASISVFVLLYPIYFLKIKRSTFAFKFIVLFITLRILYALLTLGNTFPITFHLELIAVVTSTILFIRAALNKVEDAKYMVVGLSLITCSYFIFYIAAVWIYTLGWLGFYVMYFGVAGESIFTTLALTERFKRIKLENFKKDQVSKELEKTVAEGSELITKQSKLLQEQSTELNAFLYSASHDLSGPIKSIEGLINLAIIDPEANLRELYRMMREKLSVLENNVMDLNAISIIRDRGRNPREINFEVIHQEAKKAISNLTIMNNVSISFECKIEKSFQEDYFSVKTIYQNLLENGVKFRDATKEESTLNVSIVQENRSIRMSFQDNGIGIEESKMSDVFTMFFRGNENTKNDTGLGLYIVQLAVKKLDGKIEIESVFGKGTTVTVVFPISANR